MSQDLRLERVYDAAPEVVFDAFTDPEAQKELYADAPDRIVESTIDLRAGGRWTIEFGPPGGPSALETSVFQVVDRPGACATPRPCGCPTGPASTPTSRSASRRSSPAGPG